MNPYAYSRRVQAAKRPTAWGLTRHIFSFRVSTTIAMAAIVLAAGSVMALSGVASIEIAQGDYAPVAASARLASSRPMAAFQAILGVSEDRSMESLTLLKTKSIVLSVRPHEYSAETGKWNYSVTWKRVANRQGSIYINGQVFVQNASSSGEQYTGYSITPEEKYKIIFYSEPGGKGLKLVNRVFRSLPARDIEEEDPGDDRPVLFPIPTLPTSTNTSLYKVMVPNGGESIAIGTLSKISWSGPGDGGPVRIYADQYNEPCASGHACIMGYRTYLLALDQPASGSFEWSAGATAGPDGKPQGMPAGKYRISIVPNNSKAGDVSDSPFTLTKANQ